MDDTILQNRCDIAPWIIAGILVATIFYACLKDEPQSRGLL